MKTQLLFGMMLLGASSACFGVDLSGISDSNGVISIVIDPAITGDEYVAASVATNLAASGIVRLAAIQTLAKNPTPHLDTLRVVSHDSELAIQIAAAEAGNSAAHGLKRQAQKFADIGACCRQIEDRSLMAAAALRIHKREQKGSHAFFRGEAAQRHDVFLALRQFP